MRMFVAYPPMINWDIVDPSDRNRIISEAFNGQKSEKKCNLRKQAELFAQNANKNQHFWKKKIPMKQPRTGLGSQIEVRILTNKKC